MSKKSLHPSGRTIIFEEEYHQYFIESAPEIRFTSGTTFLHKFTTPFDKDRISKNYALKHKLQQEEVLTQWENKGRTSRENGTEVHAYLEDLFNKKPAKTNTTNEVVAKMQKVSIDLFSKISSMYNLVEAEKIVADVDNCVAGMVDLIGKKDSTVIILDYKTNAKIDRENPWQTMKYPVQKLQDSNFNQYSLQLNIYQNIMMSQLYFPPETTFERYLLHITPDQYEIIECPDLQNEVNQMFKAWRS